MGTEFGFGPVAFETSVSCVLEDECGLSRELGPELGRDPQIHKDAEEGRQEADLGVMAFRLVLSSLWPPCHVLFGVMTPVGDHLLNLERKPIEGGPTCTGWCGALPCPSLCGLRMCSHSLQGRD